MTEDRLTRIEKKLDQLTEAVGIIVRIEERLIAVNNRIDLHETRINNHSKTIDDVRERQIKTDSVSGWYTAGFWAAAGGLISVAVYMFTH